MTGRTLAHYHVTEKLGAGGMGEVYRARDTRLHRDVAIKVLAPAFAQDPERLARFEREAQLLAQLNHQNIAAIYGFEQDRQECLSYLVLEYVPGENLKSPLPLEEALPIARKIIDAMEEAHEKGIIHRDLKPGNIRITPDGKVKVLDFGLAKALADDPPHADPARSPTMSLAATRAGTILGTAAYMSPEQARGRPLDRRTDIWSFGCVLYEMLTGRQAFGHDDVTDTIAAVVRAEPDFAALPPATPPHLRALLERCLRKDPLRRLRDIGEARLLFDEPPPAPVEPVPVEAPPPPAPPPPQRRRALPWAAASLFAIAAAASTWLWLRAPQPAQRPVLRLTMPLHARIDPRGAYPALSPDGAYLAFVAGSPRQIYIRQLDQPDAKPIPGTEDGYQPFFSPDGRWLGFHQTAKLKKVPVTGGATIALCDTDTGSPGSSWGADGTIVFAAAQTTGLSRVSAAGGKPEVLTKLDKGERSHRWPQVLPGGRAVVFTVSTEGQTSSDDARIAVLSLETGARRVLVEGGTHARYVPTSGQENRAGHLVYWRAGSLFAVPFDLKTLQVTGHAAPILEGVNGVSGFGHADFGFSNTGALAYAPGAPSAGLGRTLAWVDRQGKVEPIPAPPRAYSSPRLSPDGQRAAFDMATGGSGASSDIWVYEFARGTLTRLTFQGSNINPIWTPDGKRITFGLTHQGKSSLASVAADGSGSVATLASVEQPSAPNSWSPDGKILLFGAAGPARDIRILPGTGTGERKPQRFIESQFGLYNARFSPDGRWIAYISIESGQAQVYVQPAPGPDGKAQGGGKWQISTDGGTGPRWSANGRELFYLGSALGGKLMVAPIEPGPTFRAGVPKPLFELRLGARQGFDLHPDGKRFLVVLAPGQEETSAQPGQLNFVLEWFDEIRRRVDAGR